MNPLSSTKSKRSGADVDKLLVGFRKKGSFDVLANSLNSLKSLGSFADAKRAQGLNASASGSKNATWDTQQSMEGSKTLTDRFLSLVVKEEQEEVPQESNISACAIRDEANPMIAMKRGSCYLHVQSDEDKPKSPMSPRKNVLTLSDMDELNQIEGCQ